jgi:hypothetical protein
MLGIQKLATIESRGFVTKGPAPTKSKTNQRIFLLFLLVVLGILANWFWGIGWEYLAKPERGLILGPPLTVVVRIILSFFAAALTFVPTYNKINQSTSESWVPYLLAFQNGFFWQAALDAVARQF